MCESFKIEMSEANFVRSINNHVTGFQTKKQEKKMQSKSDLRGNIYIILVIVLILISVGFAKA